MVKNIQYLIIIHYAIKSISINANLLLLASKIKVLFGSSILLTIVSTPFVSHINIYILSLYFQYKYGPNDNIEDELLAL